MMSDAEFERWLGFYQMYPFDDFNRIHRPAALIAAKGAGSTNVRAMLDFLAPSQADSELSDADANTIRAFGFKRKGG